MFAEYNFLVYLVCYVGGINTARRYPSMADEKVSCHTPTPGKQSINIARWKYDAIRDAILTVLGNKTEGVVFRELPKLIKQFLTPTLQADIGSISWYTTVVKLDMEVKGEIRRIPGSKPQRLRAA